MSTKNKWLVVIGIALILVVLFALPFVWQAVFPAQGFGMMGYGYGHAPMMNGNGFSPMTGGRGGMGFGFGLMGLFPLTALALLGLSIAALVKYLRAP